ncbi:hypothetical protein Vadar_018497 [Vaccinium darrowii]|uniref:Uncharacterized protein n=1 Tax=Vaccinium darrowii TaxID=229202 RepID=A0ACB7YWJ7_9ERIC|nr:hypothetical protein Vadar_018497 [Vaccinium darrowii]
MMAGSHGGSNAPPPTVAEPVTSSIVSWNQTSKPAGPLITQNAANNKSFLKEGIILSGNVVWQCFVTSRFASGFTPLQKKPLNSIIDIERAKDLPPEDLIAIWDDYHLGRGHIGTSMTAKLYHLMEQRAANCRYFVVPLWKGSGYTTMFAQVQMPHMLFTGLEDYKAKGTQASAYFAVSYYTEFAENKDLVLIRGDVVFTSKVTDSEAKWLLETTQSFYLNDNRFSQANKLLAASLWEQIEAKENRRSTSTRIAMQD